jgi:hypothetical protein
MRTKLLKELEHHRAEIDALAVRISQARGIKTSQSRSLIESASARVLRHRIQVALLESRLAAI